MRYSRCMEDEPAVDIWQFNSQIWNITGDRPTPVIHQTATLMNRLRTPGGFITETWPYLFATAGLILFAMLVWGSLEIQFGAATPKSAESGKQRITNAVIGFVLLFSVFWMGQLIQQIFGLNFAVGQEVSVPAEGGGGGGGTDPPPVPEEPLEAFSLTATTSGNQLRLCASSSQSLRSYPAQVRSSLYRNGVIVNERTSNLQAGETTRCANVTSIASVQQTMAGYIYSAVPEAANAGITWQTVPVQSAEQPDRFGYTVRPLFPEGIAAEVRDRVAAAITDVNVSGNQEVVRVDIGGVVRTFTITYRFADVLNPAQ